MSVEARPIWRIETLGGLLVTGGATPVTGAASQRKTSLLLAVLASAGAQGISREKLLGLFWPDSDSDRARHGLKQALHTLRRDLREPELIVGTTALRLNPDSITSDLQEFEDAVARGDLERAAALHRGPFLDGLYLDGTPELERWIERERGRLAQAHAGVLERLAVAAAGAGDQAAAAGWWRRLAATDPLSSRVAVALMRSLAAAGEPEAALQHARVHEALVRDELETAPDPAVAAEVERVRAQLRAGPVASPAPAPVPAPAVVREPKPTPSAAFVVDVVPDEPRPRRRPTRRAVVIGVALGLALAIVAVVSAELVDLATPTPSPPGPRSVAVLPFVDMSGDSANVYFSDGLSEELITALSQVEGLRVAARTSSFALRDARLDVRTIGDTLGVSAVVEGSVRRDGDRLRVTAQLIDAQSGYHLWASTYDRDLEDVFAVQDEIAAAIAAALRLRLAPPRGERAAARTANREAYDLHLRATHLRNRLTREDIAKAVAYYDRVIALDPGYALAYAGKASAMGPLLYFRQVPNEPTLTEMRTAARRALELDDQLGEAHVAMGIIHFFYDWNWPEAGRAFRRATELNPLDAHAFHHLANWLRATGHADEAIAARTRSLELDPLNSRTAISLGRDYVAAGRLEPALEYYRRGIDIDSMNPLLLGIGPGLPRGVGEVRDWQGRHAEAVDEYVRIAARRGATAGEVRAMRAAFADAGMPGFWRRWLAFEERVAGEAGGRPRAIRVAALHARIGDTARAVAALERAMTERDPALVYLGVDPEWAAVRRDPRVAAMVARIGRPRAAR